MKALRFLFRYSQMIRRVYSAVSGFFLWTGALSGLALLNITDSESWKTLPKAVVAIAFLFLTLPLIPFLVIGLGMLMAGDKIDASSG